MTIVARHAYFIIAIVFVVVFASVLAKRCVNGGEDPPLDSVKDSRESRTPKLSDWINDYASVLSSSDRERLSDLLRNYQHETNHQIVVLIVATLRNESIENFSLRAFNHAGIGRKGLNDGILVTVAMKERQVRIELGKGMTHFISNADAEAIIVKEITPLFSRGDIAGGLERGLRILMEEARRFTVRGEIVEKPTGVLVITDQRLGIVAALTSHSV